MAQRFVRFSPWQSAKTMAVMYFLFALIIAIPLGLIMSAAPEIPGQARPGLLVFLLMPFLYGLAALIFVPLACWIYNVSAKLVGGVEVAVETQSDA
jgi:cell shape-determining protein MreD